MRVKLVLTNKKHKMHDDAELDVGCNEFKNIQHKNTHCLPCLGDSTTEYKPAGSWKKCRHFLKFKLMAKISSFFAIIFILCLHDFV